MLFLSIYIKYAKPCKIYSWNIVDMGFFMISSWACLITAIIHIEHSVGIGYICLGFGILLLGLFMIIKYCKSKKQELNADNISMIW